MLRLPVFLAKEPEKLAFPAPAWHVHYEMASGRGV